MTKLCITADLQCDDYTNYSKVLADGMNSRLKNIIDTLEQMYSYCIKEDIKIFVINGDILHHRDRIKVPVYLAIYKMLEKFKNNNIDIYLNLGNHDIIDQSNDIFALYPFSKIAKIVRTVGSYDISVEDNKKLRLGFCAYSEDINTVKLYVQKMIDDKCDIIFLHCGIDGAVVGPNDYLLKNNLTLKDVQYTKFKQVFLGHYHKHQQLAKNVTYIGSPLQLDFGERNDEKGFIVYDSIEDKVEFVETKYPKFIEIEYEDIDKIDLKGNFIKIKTSKDPMKVYEEIIQKGAEYCVVIKETVEKKKNRLDIDLTTSLDSIFKKYIVYMNKQNLDKDFLFDIGMGIYKEVGEK